MSCYSCDKNMIRVCKCFRENGKFVTYFKPDTQEFSNSHVTETHVSLWEMMRSEPRCQILMLYIFLYIIYSTWVGWFNYNPVNTPVNRDYLCVLYPKSPELKVKKKVQVGHFVLYLTIFKDTCFKMSFFCCLSASHIMYIMLLLVLKYIKTRGRYCCKSYCINWNIHIWDIIFHSQKRKNPIQYYTQNVRLEQISKWGQGLCCGNRLSIHILGLLLLQGSLDPTRIRA